METFSIVFPDVISDESLHALMLKLGAYLTSGIGRQYCLERHAAAIYISIEEDADRDLDSFQRVTEKVPWVPRSVILLTVSRKEGSVFLAFEVASCMASRWKGFIDWSGLDQWEEWFQRWKRSNRRQES